MEVILLERVEKLGQIGDVVTVKNGFARNYLLPNKKALRANEANKKVFEANRAKIEADNASRRSDAEKASSSVDGKTVQLIRQASNTGQLYGSVSARDIVEALDAEGAKVSKSQIVLKHPIKAIGMHEVKVALHPRSASASRSTSPARPKRPSCRPRASMSWRRCSSATKPASPRSSIRTPSRAWCPRKPLPRSRLPLRPKPLRTRARKPKPSSLWPENEPPGVTPGGFFHGSSIPFVASGDPGFAGQWRITAIPSVGLPTRPTIRRIAPNRQGTAAPIPLFTNQERGVA